MTTDAKPKRVQRRRVKGWKMPANTVYVGRPTKWGNPFVVSDTAAALGIEAARADCVSSFREAIRRDDRVYIEFDRSELAELRGKDLACWCPLDQPCHADVLLELANAPEVKS